MESRHGSPREGFPEPDTPYPSAGPAPHLGQGRTGARTADPGRADPARRWDERLAAAQSLDVEVDSGSILRTLILTLTTGSTA
ncbi:hypothetical protein OG389_02755 [Streptomyces sp. NBC_00435]|uniref:hypothetical protein n=1 Tax=Streptomyces sp. NBC_00435 TaxID=2903649 RepID=UPI002E222419